MPGMPIANKKPEATQFQARHGMPTKLRAGRCDARMRPAFRQQALSFVTATMSVSM